MNVDIGIWGKLSRVVILLLVVAGLIGVGVWYYPLIKNNEALRKEIMHLKAQVKQEEEVARQLDASIKALRNDPRTIERVAREKLGYVKTGETMIRFEEGPATQAAPR